MTRGEEGAGGPQEAGCRSPSLPGAKSRPPPENAGAYRVKWSRKSRPANPSPEHLCLGAGFLGDVLCCHLWWVRGRAASSHTGRAAVDVHPASFCSHVLMICLAHRFADPPRHRFLLHCSLRRVRGPPRHPSPHALPLFPLARSRVNLAFHPERGNAILRRGKQ